MKDNLTLIKVGLYCITNLKFTEMIKKYKNTIIGQNANLPLKEEIVYKIFGITFYKSETITNFN